MDSILNFFNINDINKGLSNDKKYCVSTCDGEKFLLRITLQKKGLNYPNVILLHKNLKSLGVKLSCAVDCGTCAEGYYLLQTWIDGNDAIDVIPTLDQAKQYVFGFKAGKTLNKIHSIQTCPKQRIDERQFIEESAKTIKKYNDCSVKFDKDCLIIDCIKQNPYLNIDRYRSLIHGDYHIGNMMIQNDELFIIDFDRCEYGDPWMDFRCMVWSANQPSFARGIIDGYFNSIIPLEFWKTLKVYICDYILSIVIWSVNIGHKKTEEMIQQAYRVLQWYSDMRDDIPSWYRNENRHLS